MLTFITCCNSVLLLFHIWKINCMIHKHKLKCKFSCMIVISRGLLELPGMKSSQSLLEMTGTWLQPSLKVTSTFTFASLNTLMERGSQQKEAFRLPNRDGHHSLTNSTIFKVMWWLWNPINQQVRIMNISASFITSLLQREWNSSIYEDTLCHQIATQKSRHGLAFVCD